MGKVRDLERGLRAAGISRQYAEIAAVASRWLAAVLFERPAAVRRWTSADLSPEAVGDWVREHNLTLTDWTPAELQRLDDGRAVRAVFVASDHVDAYEREGLEAVPAGAAIYLTLRPGFHVSWLVTSIAIGADDE